MALSPLPVATRLVASAGAPTKAAEPVPPVSASPVDAAPAEIVGPGCTRRRLPGPHGARAWRVDFAPGGSWSMDRRNDTGEAYLVLGGEILDGDRRYGTGTWVTVRPGARHRPRSETGAQLLGFHLTTDAFLGAGGDPAALVGELHVPQG